jgi:hypothetical protein
MYIAKDEPYAEGNGHKDNRQKKKCRLHRKVKNIDTW